MTGRKLLRYSAFFLDVQGFILGHVTFEDQLTKKKCAFWISKEIYSKVPVFPRASLQDYRDKSAGEVLEAPMNLDPTQLQDLAELVVINCYASVEILEIRSLLKIS